MTDERHRSARGRFDLVIFSASGTTSAGAFCAILRPSIEAIPPRPGEAAWDCLPATGYSAAKDAKDLEKSLYAGCGARVIRLNVSVLLFR